MLAIQAQHQSLPRPWSGGTNAEFTVRRMLRIVQKFNQGTIVQTGCNRLGVSFLLLFGQAKRRIARCKRHALQIKKNPLPHLKMLNHKDRIVRGKHHALQNKTS
jgi:hypothetical protein